MKLKEVLAVISDDLGDVCVDFDNSVMTPNGASSKDIMSHLDDEVIDIRVHRNKLRICLENPTMFDSDYSEEAN